MSALRDFSEYIAKTAPVNGSGAATSAAVPGAAGPPPGAAGPPPGAAKKPGKGGKKVEKIDFDDDEAEVVVVGQERGLPGRSGEVMITDELTKLQTYIGDYWSEFSEGINKFESAMTLASEAEAEPQMLNATFSAVCKAALDFALDQLAAGLEDCGPWGTIISAVKGAVQIWVADSERVAGAVGQVKLKSYLASLRDTIKPGRDGMRQAVDDGTPALIAEYRRLAMGDVAKGKPTDDGRIIGDAATVLTKVKHAVAAFKKASPSAATFQARFTRNFAYTPGTQSTGGGGFVETGVLQFEICLYREAEGKPFSVDEDNSGNAWTLYTKSPNPDRIAESLVATLGSQKPWQLDFPKKVKITVETEAFLVDDYATIWIAFDGDPNSYRLNSGNADLAKIAWNYAQARVLGNMQITGSNG
jgi:hypothetical protein